MRDVHVKVLVGAKKEVALVRKDGHFLISVAEPRKEGRANERARELLSKHFGVPGERIRLIRGRTTPTKVFRVYDDEVPPTARRQGGQSSRGSVDVPTK
jgi:uncharacterized protein YggU (UPF0235/DUF167 family)